MKDGYRELLELNALPSKKCLIKQGRSFRFCFCKIKQLGKLTQPDVTFTYSSGNQKILHPSTIL